MFDYLKKIKITFCVKGVISPLLANIYLHWFEKVFYAASGPAVWAKAYLVRYADDCAPRRRREEAVM